MTSRHRVVRGTIRPDLVDADPVEPLESGAVDVVGNHPDRARISTSIPSGPNRTPDTFVPGIASILNAVVART